MGLDDVQYETMSRPFASQDTLILYSDGLIERRDESLDAGLARLADAAASGPSDPSQLCKHVLKRALPEERQLYDDVTLVIVRVACGGVAPVGWVAV